MQDSMKKLAGRVIEEFGTKKDVLAVFIFGSAIRGGFDRYSDVDFFVLLKRKRTYSRKNFLFEGVRADILFETEKDIEKYLATDKGNVRRIASHMLAHSKIIFARDGSGKKLQAMAKRNLKGKTRYTRSEILMHLYSIEDFLGAAKRDAERGDIVAFELDSHLLVNNAIELLLKFEGEYLRQPREMRDIFGKTDPGFVSLLERLYGTIVLGDKAGILEELTEYAYRKAGGPMPDSWEV
jgi:predicted nucleotidyltransferase